MLLLLAGVALMGYLYIEKSKKVNKDIYELVPSDAVLMFDIKKPVDSWHQVVNNSIIWDELLLFDDLKAFEATLSALDTAIAKLPDEKNIMKDGRVLLAFFADSGTRFNVVYLFETRDNTTPAMLDMWTKELLGAGKVTRAENALLGEVAFDRKKVFTALAGNVAIIGTTRKLVERVAKTGEESPSVLNVPSFVEVKETAGIHEPVNVFVNTARLRTGITGFFNNDLQKLITGTPEPAEWAELDLYLKPDEVAMGGFTTAYDSLSNWLALLKGHAAVSPNVINHIPDRTAWMFHIGSDRMGEYLERYFAYSRETLDVDRKKKIREWDDRYDISLQENFIKWIEREIVLVLAEPEREEFSDEFMVWINVSDASTVMKRLNDAALKVANTNDEEMVVINYKDHEIRKLSIEGLLDTCLGTPFSAVTENYYTRIRGYIVFANSPALLQWAIDRRIRNKTLGKDLDFVNYRSRIERQANVFVYNNIAASTWVYSHYTDPVALAGKIPGYRELIRKFQAFSMQISWERDNLYYTHINIKYNPVYKEETKSLWEVKLDTVSRFKPVIVRNHYTGAKEIVVQDNNNNLYLVNNKGKILWKRKLDNPVMGRIKQVDAFRNGKLQLLFNTETSVYLIDRNGRDVEKFPVKIKNGISVPLTLVDFDKKKYRIYVGGEDGDLYNFDIKGNRVKGWMYQPGLKKIVSPVKYFAIRNKDYLVVVYEDGSVSALNRKGVVRLSLKKGFTANTGSEVSLHKGKSLEKTYLLGVAGGISVERVSFEGNHKQLFALADTAALYGFEHVDDDKAEELIVVNDSALLVFDLDGKLMFKVGLRGVVNRLPGVYHFEDRAWFGYVTPLTDELWLQDAEGNIYPEFPYNGTSPFTISDINNDDRLDLITVDAEGVLLVYSLDN